MLQVLAENDIQCQTCMKRDVCKYQEEYRQTYLNIRDDFHNLQENVFEIKLNCKKYVGTVITTAETYPWGVRGVTGDPEIMLLNDAVKTVSKEY